MGTVGSRLLEIAPRLFAIVLAAGLRALVSRQLEPLGRVGRRAVDRRRLPGADLTPLSAQVAGRIRRVAVGDFQEVQEGESFLVEIGNQRRFARNSIRPRRTLPRPRQR